jgi:ABC-type branched-subunit amino acid transport system substrate-binding protein
MRSPICWIGIVAAVLFVACARPPVLRDGVPVPYEEAAAADLVSAREHLAGGRPDEARHILDRFLVELDQSSRIDEALFLLGEAELALGEREAAAASWRRVVEEHRRSRLSPEAGFRAAEVYRDLGRPEDGRRVVERVDWRLADDRLRPRIHRLRADLARSAGDYADAVRALALSRRDTGSADALMEIDLELDELIDDRLRDSELEILLGSLPRGPVYDRVNLAIARRALARSDYAAAEVALARLPRRLREIDEVERRRLLDRTRRGSAAVVETLGLALPLSGPYSPFGEAVLEGVVLALELFDSPDGRYRVAIRDTEGEPEAGLRAVNELVEQGVSAIIGPLRSVVSAAAAPAAERGGTPLLTLAKREDISQLGDFVFRLGLTASDEMQALASYAIEVREYRRFAILYPDDEQGVALKNLFWDQVEALGGQIVGVENYDREAVDVQVEIKKLVGLYYLTEEEVELLELRARLLRRPLENAVQLEDPSLADLPPYVDFDALFIPDVAQKVGLILPQLRFYDISDVTYLGGSEWNSPELAERGGREAMRTIFVDEFFAWSSQPHIESFVQRYYAAYGRAPDSYAAEGYDAAMLLRGLIQADGLLSREQLRRRILSVRNYSGMTGLTSFDRTGGTRKSPSVLTVNRGAIQLVKEVP